MSESAPRRYLTTPKPPRGATQTPLQRFKDRDDLGWQQEIIAWSILAVIFGSMVYYAVVFASEIFGYSPRRCFRKCRGIEDAKSVGERFLNHSIDMIELAENPLQVGPGMTMVVLVIVRRGTVIGGPTLIGH